MTVDFLRITNHPKQLVGCIFLAAQQALFKNGLFQK